MTTFENGPAKGKTLMLRRAPLFLRVVMESASKIDALDKIDDQPAPNELIHVYQLTGEAGSIHINARGTVNSGFFTVARYREVDPQPPDIQVRSTEAWQNWTRNQSPCPA